MVQTFNFRTSIQAMARFPDRFLRQSDEKSFATKFTGLDIKPWLEYQTFEIRTLFCALNIGLVRYSDVVCICKKLLWKIIK